MFSPKLFKTILFFVTSFFFISSLSPIALAYGDATYYQITSTTVPASSGNTDNLSVSMTCKRIYNEYGPSSGGLDLWVQTTNLTRGGTGYTNNKLVERYGGNIYVAGLKTYTDTIEYNEVKTATLTLSPSDLKAGDSIKLTFGCSLYNVSSTGGETYQQAFTTTKTINITQSKTAEEIAAENRAAEVKAHLTSISDFFAQKGLSIGDITGLTEEQAGAYGGLLVENQEMAKIEFQQQLNLMSEDLVADPQRLANAIVFANGSVSIDSETVPELNIPAKITLYGLKFNPEKPTKIFKNGEYDEAVNQTVTIESENSLSFTVDGFSTYSVGPGLTIEGYNSKTKEEQVTIKGSVTDLTSSILVAEEDREVALDENGNFEFVLTLEKGENNFTFNATNANGTTEDLQVNITRSSGISAIAIVGIILASLAGLGVLLGGGYLGYKKFGKKLMSKKEKQTQPSSKTSVNGTQFEAPKEKSDSMPK